MAPRNRRMVCADGWFGPTPLTGIFIAVLLPWAKYLISAGCFYSRPFYLDASQIVPRLFSDSGDTGSGTATGTIGDPVGKKDRKSAREKQAPG